MKSHPDNLSPLRKAFEAFREQLSSRLLSWAFGLVERAFVANCFSDRLI